MSTGVDVETQPKESAVYLAARIAPQQRVKYVVTPQDNALMSCEGLGGQIAAIGKLIKQTAKEDGLKAHALVGGISMDPNTGSITCEIVIATDIK